MGWRWTESRGGDETVAARFEPRMSRTDRVLMADAVIGPTLVASIREGLRHGMDGSAWENVAPKRRTLPSGSTTTPSCCCTRPPDRPSRRPRYTPNRVVFIGGRDAQVYLDAIPCRMAVRATLVCPDGESQSFIVR